MKVADVKFTWVKSVSLDVSKQEFILSIPGVGETTTEIPVNVEEFVSEISAMTSGTFTLKVTDSEGRVALSVSQGFTIPDLEDPVAPTNLDYEIIGVRDVPDPVSLKKKKAEGKE